MESIGILDPLSELFALHLVYQPRVDKALKDFISFWNNHKLRTKGAWTDYGVDEEASTPLDVIQTDNNVVVSSCLFQLSEEEITTLNEIDVFAHGGNTGISIYLQVVNLLRTFESIERNTKMYSKTKSRFFLCLVKIKQKHHAGHFFFPWYDVIVTE